MLVNEPKSSLKRTFTVIKPFKVKTVSGAKELQPGATLNLTSEKAAELIRQGFIAEVATAEMLIKWRTDSGRIIYLAESNHCAAKVLPGCPFFLSGELEAMRGLDRRTIDLLIDAKGVFPGCTVEKTDAQNGPME